jgi:ribosomal protein S18 acetylase RimI-like enzyme
MIEYSNTRNDGDTQALHAMLKETYWAADRSPEQVARTIESSVCVFARHADHGLVGFARALTDGVAYSWICDVVVNQDFRGRGIGKELVRRLASDPAVAPTRMVLVTKDAQGLYAQFGFITHPFECMVHYPTPELQAAALKMAAQHRD